MGDARVMISVRDGVFEFSGPAEFVEKQMEQHREQIAAALTVPKRANAASGGGGKAGREESEEEGEGETPTPAADIEDVVSIDEDGKVSVTADVEGSSAAAKQVNISLLVGLVIPEGAPFSKIQDVCKDHACHDRNFAQNIKAHKALFRFLGTGRSQVAKLTRAGKTKALALVETLRASVDA
jgi:hypothetical protein